MHRLRRSGSQLTHVAFPLGGLGAGSLCVTGAGGFTHVALRHRPAMNHAPLLFAALGVAGHPEWARVLEGPVPTARVFGAPHAGLGWPGSSWGLPRWGDATFAASFPFAEVTLADAHHPVAVALTAWSPFSPGAADDSSLPVAGLEYTLGNQSPEPLDLVFSFHAANFLARQPAAGEVRATADGFALHCAATAERPYDAATFQAVVDDPAVAVDAGWFRGGWFDSLTMVWREVAHATATARPAPADEGGPSPGGSLYLPVRLEAGERRTIVLRLSWYVPRSEVRRGGPPEEAPPAAEDESATHRPWYAGRFSSAEAVDAYWGNNYERLREEAARFSRCLHESTIPPEVIEAVAANLCILKSPTVLRQIDGRLWAWEGCDDEKGSCYGSCTHVWNYAQAVAHLFPALERGLRETEHHEALGPDGHQQFRVPLPIRPALHDMHPAADGQLGAIVKVYRDWRISGDQAWLVRLWPYVRRSLEFAIRTWDPDRAGWLVEPQHNTYDVEFWGPNGMLTSVYRAALVAAAQMARALGEDADAIEELAARAQKKLEQDLFTGELFTQEVRWQGLRAPHPADYWSLGGKYSPEARQLLAAEGPKYQYGRGCLADGVIGAWMATVAGLQDVIDPAQVRRHLRAVYRHNFRRSLAAHANPQRPGYALGDEPGLLLCTWPDGGCPTLPFVYANEVWTGVEYQVASHLLLCGERKAGLEIVRAVRQRYDGQRRNPFAEYECGHWYGRALSSYALLQACSGARFDAVENVLHLAPPVAGDFACFLAWDGGYGTVGVRAGRPFLEIVGGSVPPHEFRYRAASTSGQVVAE